jgi:uncharacterized spore protein YtfJ
MMAKTSLKPEELSAALEKSAATAVEPVERTMERYLELGSVKSVYNSPVKHGETMIIPAAEVVGALGFGMGAGLGEGGSEQAKSDQPSKSSTDEKAEAGGSGAGAGGGGGGYVFARPVAVIVSGPEGVRVEPVVDSTKIALALFTALGFMFSMSLRMFRGPR